jgi:outer membrane biosynthesis protein TonB
MLPGSEKRKKRNSSKVNLLISLAFHGVLMIALVYFAARQGLLGKQLKKIAVEMVKEKPPEKPKEPEKPKDEVPKAEPQKIVTAPKIEAPKEAPPPSANPVAAPPAVAPPAVDVSSFVFEGGKAVETSSDPVQVYKGLIEYSLHSRWNRPEDMDDHAFVAEVEVAVDRSGQISDPVWKKGSGNQRWDDSVRQALALAKGTSRPPPTNFPPRVTVRFDVVAATPIAP